GLILGLVAFGLVLGLVAFGLVLGLVAFGLVLGLVAFGLVLGLRGVLVLLVLGLVLRLVGAADDAQNQPQNHHQPKQLLQHGCSVLSRGSLRRLETSRCQQTDWQPY